MALRTRTLTEDVCMTPWTKISHYAWLPGPGYLTRHDSLDQDISLCMTPWPRIPHSAWLSSYGSYLPISDLPYLYMVHSQWGILVRGPQRVMHSEVSWSEFLGGSCTVRYPGQLQIGEIVSKINPISMGTLDNFGTNPVDIQKSIIIELQNILKWLDVNKLCLNVSKSKFMLFHMPQKGVPYLSFSLNGLEIEHVYNFKFLGLIINCHLDWKPHLNSIGIKVARKWIPKPELSCFVN